MTTKGEHKEPINIPKAQQDTAALACHLVRTLGPSPSRSVMLPQPQWEQGRVSNQKKPREKARYLPEI